MHWSAILLSTLLLFMTIRIMATHRLVGRWAREEHALARARAIRISTSFVAGGLFLSLLGEMFASQVVVDAGWVLIALTLLPPLVYLRRRRE